MFDFLETKAIHFVRAAKDLLKIVEKIYYYYGSMWTLDAVESQVQSIGGVYIVLYALHTNTT